MRFCLKYITYGSFIIQIHFFLFSVTKTVWSYSDYITRDKTMDIKSHSVTFLTGFRYTSETRFLIRILNKKKGVSSSVLV